MMNIPASKPLRRYGGGIDSVALEPDAMTDPPNPAAPSRPKVFCLLSDEQRAEFTASFAGFRQTGIEWIFETSPEDALDRIGEIEPKLVFVGMTIGATEGLEFLAFLLKRYRGFAGKVVVLPGRDDPFAPVIQARDPVTGRSTTVHTDLAGLAELVASLVPPPDVVASTAAAAPRAMLKATQMGLGAPAEAATPGPSIKPQPTMPIGPSEPVAPETAPAPEPPPAMVTPPEPVAAHAPMAEPPAPVYAEMAMRPDPAQAAEPPRPAGVSSYFPLLLAGVALVLAVLAGGAWLLFSGRSALKAPSVPRASAALAQPVVPRPAESARAAPAIAESAQPAPPASTPQSAPVETPASGQYLTLPFAFERNSDEYTVANSAELEAMVARVKSALAAKPGLRLEVGGHASGDGSEARNEHLGYARATKVVAYLGTQGVASHRIRVRSYGTSLPAASGSAGEARNRRVTLRLLDK
jgi:outer membrane protein OmpA-like peptidoglycan-associated protein